MLSSTAHDDGDRTRCDDDDKDDTWGEKRAAAAAERGRDVCVGARRSGKESIAARPAFWRFTIFRILSRRCRGHGIAQYGAARNCPLGDAAADGCWWEWIHPARSQYWGRERAASTPATGHAALPWPGLEAGTCYCVLLAAPTGSLRCWGPSRCHYWRPRPLVASSQCAVASYGTGVLSASKLRQSSHASFQVRSTELVSPR